MKKPLCRREEDAHLVNYPVYEATSGRIFPFPNPGCQKLSLHVFHPEKAMVNGHETVMKPDKLLRYLFLLAFLALTVQKPQSSLECVGTTDQ